MSAALKTQVSSAVGQAHRTGGAHSQWPVALFSRQVCPGTGQAPSQIGAIVNSQAVGWHTHETVPLGSLVQVSPDGQTPSQTGWGDCAQGVGSHSQAPVAALARHISLAGQVPLHPGAGPPQGAAGGLHSQAKVAVLNTQAWAAPAHAPPQVGVGDCSQLIGSQAHEATPLAWSGTQTSPAGQSPPHEG
jgi:hypothetical protein